VDWVAFHRNADGPVEDRHADIVANLLAWVATEENIRAVIQTGSASRTDGRQDRYSDRDIELICRDPAPYLADDAWFRALGPVWTVERFDEPGDGARLVWYAGARKIDFSLTDFTHTDRRRAGTLDDLYERGYRVLLDKDGIGEALPRAGGRSPRVALPSARTFAETVDLFWFEATHMPSALTRGDLWMVKIRENDMHDALLPMLMWHAAVTRGSDTDTWHAGSKMRSWTDDATWQEVHGIFGGFDAESALAGILAKMRLFSRVSEDVAAALGFTISPAIAEVREYVEAYAVASRR
jgi:aminoglycoside 6-adenylyltransferase